MELFGRSITKKEAAEGAAITAVVAAAITALALWGNKDIGFKISSQNTCQDNSPTIIKSSGKAILAIRAAEVDLAARYYTKTGTPTQLAAARFALSGLTESGSTPENPIFKDLDPNDLTCAPRDGQANQLGLSADAEQILGELRAAGVEVDLTNS